jgi:hypothetical protein
MTLLDPLVLQSSLNKYQSTSFADKLKRLNSTYLWFNCILPICAIIALGLFIRSRFHEKRELYDEFVPSHLNYFDY